MLKQLAAIAVSVLAVVSACKKDSPEGGATGSSSTTAAAGGALSGDCKFVIDKPRCQPGGKAAFCAMNGGHPAWSPFACPDCAATDHGVKCSDFTVGDPCDGLSTESSSCSKDGKNEYTCDVTTSKWTVRACPGGCKGDMKNGLSCN